MLCCLRYYFFYALSLTCYHIGDMLCFLSSDWSAELYQRAMKWSYRFDEKIGFALWKKP